MLLLLQATSYANGTPEVVNNSTGDVTVTFARVKTRTMADVFDLADCDRITTSISKAVFDCKPAIEKATGHIFLRPHFYVRGSYHQKTGQFEEQSHVLNSQLAELNIAVKTVALKTMSSIGFFTTTSSDLLFFNPKMLPTHNKARLRDGSEASIYKFIVDFPTAGLYRGQPVRSFGFKPFVDFPDAPANKIYRNWDRVSGTNGMQNYYLMEGYEPYSRDVLVIDRRAEVLYQTDLPTPFNRH